MTFSQLRLEHLRLHRKGAGHDDRIARFQALANHGAVSNDLAGTYSNGFERTVRAKDFALELQVANPQRPLLSFPMSRRAAEIWCARLNAIFNA